MGRSRARHHPERLASQSFFWQGLLILLPLLVLAAAGVWSLRGQREAVEQQARQQAAEAAAFWARAGEALVHGHLIGAHPPVPLIAGEERFPFLYPLNPRPPEDLAPARLFEASLDDAEALDQILGDHPDALSESGIPLKPLILYRQYLAAPEKRRAELERELAEVVCNSHPSVLSGPILQQLGDRESSAAWQKHERIREVLRDHIEAIRKNPTPQWIETATGEIWRLEVLAHPSTGKKSIQAMPLADLPDLPAEGVRPAPITSRYFSKSIYYDGIQISPLSMRPRTLQQRQTGPADEPFAGSTEGMTSAFIFLARPGELYAPHERQVAWFIGIIAASALTALFGLWVTRRAFLKQQAVNQMKSNFVSSVSHELRAPIASIRLIAERLQAGKVEDAEKRHEYFGFIEQESRRLANLVENVLDFSRIEDGKKSYHFEETDIEQLATDTVQLMRPQAAGGNVILATDLQAPEADPAIDALEVQQALINLIDNAIKYSPEGKTITVGLGSGPAGRIKLWVQDQGQGIAENEQRKIFQRFYRIGSELERETEGVGIGLAIVRHTAEAHGGSINVDSQPGVGSRFTLELPIKQRPT